MSREAEVAARWWAEKLKRRPKFDNGDHSETSQMASLFAMFGASKAPEVTEEQKAKFEAALVEKVDYWLQKRGEAWVGVDYDPCEMLCKSCEQAGIGNISFRFPWKTRMKIQAGRVEVSEGYGASYAPLPL